ncbi:arginine--tRNA ligase [Acetonema longum]|uniref:Arginine--tRNA ligase n=1 Tax=Acetonema longum DSM 6540 TaxID=1009370 RepID=F7NH97_9FIRM|nr:arginine--tRNA ligase [Acetonema longum]EGO64580.1 arginyl-tRNA synthetase [Acetonema longum DSM 6540]
MDIKERLQQSIENAARQAVQDGAVALSEIPPVILEVPPQKDFGDFATNFAMQAARPARTNPRAVAQAIVDRLNEPWLDKAVIAGPGFINFYLKSDWLYNMLAGILAEGEQYGQVVLADKASRIQVEFVSANPTGPLHVGHGRGAAVGSALANLLRAAGYDVATEFYINDAGNQIDNLAASVNARYLELLGQSVDFPEDGYHGRDIIDTAQRIIDREGSRYLLIPVAERLAVFKELALNEKLAGLQEDLEAFGVSFDVWFSERTLHKGAIQETCQVLRQNGYMYETDGALWLKSSAYGDDKDRVVIRDNGVPTYLAADIAYHRNKLERGFDTIINIWGADHHGYIARVKAAIGALGYNPEQLEVLILQMVSLYQNGELVKMSKRTGQGVTLSELIEEVGRDAARFFFIMRSIDSQLDFDLDLAKSRSNENPVYYIQYAHARIASIFRQAAEAGLPVDDRCPTEYLKTLISEFETDLIKKIGEYPAEITAAARERAPHRIARYAHELAGLFHTFYNQCRVIGVEPELQTARLALVKAVQNTLRHALRVLGVAAPDKM